MSTLFINACVRNGSRTFELAEYLLEKIDGKIDRIDLEKEEIRPLDCKSLEERDLLLSRGEFENRRFRYARQFAQAENIIIAAPFWDLGVPALLKIYLEAITAIPLIAGKHLCGVHLDDILHIYNIVALSQTGKFDKAGHFTIG